MSDPHRVEERYKRAVVRRFFVRVHMVLILGGAFLAGLVANSLLLRGHVTFLPLRYVLAVVASYLAFFVLVRIWFAYIRWSAGALPSLDVSLDLPWSSRGAGRIFGGGRGGSFGGAGAQGSWTESTVAQQASLSSSQPRTPSVGARSSSGGSRWLSNLSFDVELDEKAVAILIAFAVLVLSIIGAAVYMIWNAPSILGDAAFQLALSASLLRATRRMEMTGWVGSVWRKTWIPFAIVAVLATTFGIVVHAYCPDSPTLRSVLTECLTPRR